MSELHEECGIIGIYSVNGRDVAPDIYYGLIALQHRGQESCGIAVTHNREISYHKGVGLVNEVFDERSLNALNGGDMGVGHVRYSTTGDSRIENAQPLVLRYIKGNLAIAHNGNLLNAVELRKEYERYGAIYQTTSDTEILAYAIARARAKVDSIEDALSLAMSHIVGAYSLILTSPCKMVAAKDPYGFRPLCMGRKNGDIVFASETTALDCIGATFERELDPGEIVVVNNGNVRSIRKHCELSRKHTCIFEYIYFARPDSVIDGQLVNQSRRLAGKFLAQEHPVDADIVIGVPDSGIQAAIGYASELNLPHEEGFIKNRYITRTFIKPDKASRSIAVSLKLNPIKEYVRGKRVCMVDDSIVRGTTTGIIVKALRDAGAKEVHVRVSSPPFRWPCYFGTDVPDREHLVAVNYTVSEVALMMGADSLAYLGVDRLADLLPNMRNPGFCAACFTGEYPLEVKRGFIDESKT